MIYIVIVCELSEFRNSLIVHLFCDVCERSFNIEYEQFLEFRYTLRATSSTHVYERRVGDG